jgi:quinol monooxygenase YgiN
MITRIVRMTIDPEKVDLFRKYFYSSCIKIRGSKGCTHLELYADAAFPNVMITFSKWQSEFFLNQYRNSEVFKETWALVKPLFIEKPFAFSMIAEKQ